ncbi:MAG: type II toxin-antitoxin system VapC family toxin [Ignavibacteriales bacterium]
MKLVLDTHAIVWWLCEPEALSRRAFAALSDEANEVLVSAACGYEIEIKRERDPLLGSVPEGLHDAVFEQGFDWLPITAEHAIVAARLPRHHGDPWDRLLVAQAMLEGATLVTCDGRLKPYGAALLW